MHLWPCLPLLSTTALYHTGWYCHRAELAWQTGYKPRWFAWPYMVTHPSINQVQIRVASLMCLLPLPQHHTVFCHWDSCSVILLLARRSLSVSAHAMDLLPSLSVGLSVYLSTKCTVAKGWLDPDAVWDGEWGWSRDGCIRWRCWSSKGKGQFLGRPIVTNEAFVA